MNSDEVARLVLAEIETYRYEPPAGLLGRPWSSDRVKKYLAGMLKALVKPYLQRFDFRHSPVMSANGQDARELWVIAEDHGYLEWYDPESGEFGLGQRVAGGLPQSIGVHGDAVGVFMAI
jgi:hypothetical protein